MVTEIPCLALFARDPDFIVPTDASRTGLEITGKTKTTIQSDQLYSPAGI